MQVFEPIPLGSPIPDSPHAVSCSLPTMAAVRGYEEKDPGVISSLKTGYPRFVIHPFARRLGEELSRRHGLGSRKLWLASSRKMALALLAHLGDPDATLFEGDGVTGVTHLESPELGQRAKLYLQNIGGFLSSREAEDRLASLGLCPTPKAEDTFPGDARSEVLRHLGPRFPGVPGSHLMLANSGMNAVHAAFSSVNAVQAPRGRTAWVQLGWLYLDTIAILKKYTAHAEDYIPFGNVMDLDGLDRLFSERAASIAGVMAEVPTNPLVQTPDLALLSALCRRHGVKLVLDPSLVSVFSADCLRHADVLVTSLTKYTGNEGDVIAGLVAVNPQGADAAALAEAATAVVDPPYSRDLARLASQIRNTEAVLAQIEETTPKVAAFLASHPAVTATYWALAAASRANYLAIARKPGATGGVISFQVRGKLEAFYDRLRLPKGPSFGMRTTLICPFMYLAHYDLVTTEAGRGELRANGLDGDLLRLCVGTEPAEEIVGALREALAGI